MRKHLLWATTALTIVLTACVMLSDLFIRTNPHTAEQGQSAHSWDVVGSIFLFVVWPIVAIDFWRYRWRTN